jgi:hypothetical protein
MSLFVKIMNAQVDKMMTEKIQNFEGEPVATSDTSGLYAALIDLNGFQFLNIKLVAPLNINTYNGCNVKFTSKSTDLEIESDTTEISTDFSSKLGIGITEFDLDLEEELISMIENDTITSISVQHERQVVHLSTIDQAALKARINLA